MPKGESKFPNLNAHVQALIDILEANRFCDSPNDPKAEIFDRTLAELELLDPDAAEEYLFSDEDDLSE